LECATQFGLVPKIHVNQFNAFGGVSMGVKFGALSVDHLEELNNEDIEALKNSRTMPVALPSCSYFLSIPYTPARRLIDAGLPLALATDYNPGSTPSGNMNFVISTACIKMEMTPEEAINAATINGAYAMDISNMYGSITKGKKANLIITKPVPSYNYLPYAFGDNHIDTVIINGQVQ
jgi:imidazolonepropionase